MLIVSEKLKLMTEWFLGCDIQLDIPVEDSEGESWFTTIAHYSGDPGFQVGDSIQLVDVSLTRYSRNGKRIRKEDIPRFSFEGLVTLRHKVVKVDDVVKNLNGEQEVLDTLKLVIRVEIADKERIPEIRKIIQDFHKKADFTK